MTPEVPAPASGGSPGDGAPGPDSGASVGREVAPSAGGRPDGAAPAEREGALSAGGRPDGAAPAEREGAPSGEGGSDVGPVEGAGGRSSGGSDAGALPERRAVTGADDTPGARRPRAERKQVLLRLDPAVHDALARWASDELRSVNAQIDMVLRRALDAEGRLPKDVRPPRRPGRPPAS
ncbi:type II toxin-antitoxin system antitoxin [Oerskovia turbata]